jgi:hypothetical protein
LNWKISAAHPTYAENVSDAFFPFSSCESRNEAGTASLLYASQGTVLRVRGEERLAVLQVKPCAGTCQVTLEGVEVFGALRRSAKVSRGVVSLTHSQPWTGTKVARTDDEAVRADRRMGVFILAVGDMVGA